VTPPKERRWAWLGDVSAGPAAQLSVTVREVRPADRSDRVILVLSAGPTPLRTVISTRPSSNSAAIWSAFVPSGRVMTRRNAP